MKKFNRFKKNSIYPKGSENSNMPSGDHQTWINEVNHLNQHQRTPQSIIREWLRLRESPGVVDGTLLNSNSREPCLVTPACNQIRTYGVEEDLNKIEECPVENVQRYRNLFRRVVERIALTRIVTDVQDGEERYTAKKRPSEEAEVHEIEFPTSRAKAKLKEFFNCDSCRTSIDPHGKFYFGWLFVVSLCYIYNLIVVPMRASFPYQTHDNTPIWLAFDGICDLMYILDVLLVKPRVSFIHDGSWVQDTEITKGHYYKTFLFKMDVISLLPLEILYLYFGTSAVALRLPRMCKAQTFSQFYTSIDKILSSPLVIRVARTLIYTFYLIHLNACSYYKMSTIEGIGSNGWVYSGEGNAYIRCFFFATKTSTSIGKNAKPENEVEYIYMTFAWLMGVCVFALLVGQIRYFIITATKSESEYRRLLAESMECMKQLNIPLDLQKRVTSWFEFTWKQQGTLDDEKSLSALPINLKTELAISMHIQTLNKVKLFTDCEQALLRDLVLKLRSIIYLPGDVICRKGDVGREMYILKRGIVEVMSGTNNDEVIATLSEGSVFGEISLLNIKGINRRTADVRSRTYSNIFILSKNDFNSVLSYYPDAQRLLLKRANDLVNINAARDRANKSQSGSASSNKTEPEKPPNDEKSDSSPSDSSQGEPAEVESKTCSVEILPCNESKDAQNEIEFISDDIRLYFEKLKRRAMPKTFGRRKIPNTSRRVDFQKLKQSSFKAFYTKDKDQ